MEALPFSEVERIIQLVAMASNSTTPDERRRALLSGLAEIVDAEVWFWVHSRTKNAGPQPTAFRCLDGGWRSSAERSAFLGAIYEPELNRAANRTLIRHEQHITFLREQFLPDDDPQLRTIHERWMRATGMDESIVSVFPAAPNTVSVVALHRRIGKKAFTPMQRDITHLLLGQVSWLHNDGHDVQANNDRLLKLSPREREVLLYLLEGDSRKQIAIRIGLSPHTVADHMKAIYKLFEVNSRAELLALFMRTGTPKFAPAT